MGYDPRSQPPDTASMGYFWRVIPHSTASRWMYYLCRRELVPLWDEQSALMMLGMLDVNGQKERCDVKNTHPIAHNQATKKAIIVVVGTAVYHSIPKYKHCFYSMFMYKSAYFYKHSGTQQRS